MQKHFELFEENMPLLIMSLSLFSKWLLEKSCIWWHPLLSLCVPTVSTRQNYQIFLWAILAKKENCLLWKLGPLSFRQLCCRRRKQIEDIWLDLNLDLTIDHLYDLGPVGASVFTSLKGKGKYLAHRIFKKSSLQIVKCYENIDDDEIHNDDNEDDDYCMSVLNHF